MIKIQLYDAIYSNAASVQNSKPHSLLAVQKLVIACSNAAARE